MARKKNRKPVSKPPVLFSDTQKVLAKLERRLGTPLLTYWNSNNGSICHNDVVAMNEIILKVGRHKRIALFVKSGGGTGRASLRIVHLLRQYATFISAVVPLNCVSAATMIALGADEIRMGPLAYLSAVDTSITHDLSPIDRDNDRVSVSQNELSRILDSWRRESSGRGANPYEAIFQHIHPLVIGAVDRASSLSIRLCTDILSYHMKDRKKAQAISRKLNSDYPSHVYPITDREAKKLGLNVKPLDHDVNDMLIELNEIYSEMGQQAYTDYDESNYHDHEIRNIIEGRGVMIYYQCDRDRHYRAEDRTWITINDSSSWWRAEKVGAKIKTSVVHTR
ncbi:MAG: hypothetical protein ACYTKD_03180 [Planctomycetota bacterium]|jgi:hypothetical protein